MGDEHSSRSAPAPLPEHEEFGSHAIGVRRSHWAGWALTWVAGHVDAVGYLTLHRVYVANMSGNSIAVGLSWRGGESLKVWQHGFPVLMFVVGLFLAGILLELGRRRHWRRVFSLALVIETSCLGAFLVCAWVPANGNSPPHAGSASMFALLVGLAALAMGIQNASLTRMGSLTIHTTHVTGSLTRMAEEIVGLAFHMVDHWREHPFALRQCARRLVKQRSFREAVHLAGLWIGYVLGALAGSLGLHWLGLLTMVAPLLVLVAFALITRSGTE